MLLFKVLLSVAVCMISVFVCLRNHNMHYGRAVLLYSCSFIGDLESCCVPFVSFTKTLMKFEYICYIWEI